MAENTKIQWCHHTFNSWRGCTKVSAACANCYAEAQAKRNPGVLGVWGPNGTRVVASEATWKEPLKWNRAAKHSGERRRVFCASMADVFEDWHGPMVDSKGKVLSQVYGAGWIGDYASADKDPLSYQLTMDDVRHRLFDLIDDTPWLIWIILTKRPENIRRMWPACGIEDSGGFSPWGEPIEVPVYYRHNVWLLTSAGTQAEADKYIPELLKCRDLVPVLGVSCEPLLEAVDLTKIKNPTGKGTWDVLHGWKPDAGSEGMNTTFLNFVIVGGESGRGARSCDVAWIRSIRDQCKAAGAACFVKQLGAITIDGSICEPDGTPAVLLGMKDKKGGDPDEWPEDLRVREFPNV